MKALPLAMALSEGEFGGKAVKLGEAINAGLPVPPGYALDVDLVEAVRRGAEAARRAVTEAYRHLGGAVAVRSSAVGEDSAGSSFAGQHLTLLNLRSAAEVVDSVARVRDSAYTEAAIGYRRRRGLADSPRMAVVLQKLVRPDSAGVMFTRNPVTGRDERVIEAAWGLGEAVVGGVVTPDVYRIDRSGRLLEMALGDKHVALRPAADGGILDEQMGESSAGDLDLLNRLAGRCETVYGPDLDIEWVIEAGRPYLLQSRAITVSQPRAAA
jgi:pyruvate,water dikinase